MNYFTDVALVGLSSLISFYFNLLLVLWKLCCNTLALPHTHSFFIKLCLCASLNIFKYQTCSIKTRNQLKSISYKDIWIFAKNTSVINSPELLWIKDQFQIVDDSWDVFQCSTLCDIHTNKHLLVWSMI